MGSSEQLRSKWIQMQSNRNAVYAALCQVRSLVNEGMSVKHACNYVLDQINLDVENIESKWVVAADKEYLEEADVLNHITLVEPENDNQKQ